MFRNEGARTDKHVREHDVYSVTAGAPAALLTGTHSRAQETGGGAHWLARSGPLGLRRSALIAAPVLFLLVVAGGVAARAMMKPEAAPAPAPAAAPALEVAPAAAPTPAAAPKRMDTLFPAKPVARLEKKPEKKIDRPAPAEKPGRLELSVTPWGEVLVDGEGRGVSPPLHELEIPAGTHTIEIRNTTFPSHKERIEMKAGEATKIRHRFH